jgi:hypothetical protein
LHCTGSSRQDHRGTGLPRATARPHGALPSIPSACEALLQEGKKGPLFQGNLPSQVLSAALLDLTGGSNTRSVLTLMGNVCSSEFSKWRHPHCQSVPSGRRSKRMAGTRARMDRRP